MVAFCRIGKKYRAVLSFRDSNDQQANRNIKTLRVALFYGHLLLVVNKYA